MYRLDNEQCGAVVRKAARQLFLYCKNSGIHYVVTGSSGGRDSAITLALAQRACQMAKKEKYQLTSVGVVLPCDSPHKFTVLGRLAVKTFGAELIEEDLSYDFESMYSSYSSFDVVDGINDVIANIKVKNGEQAHSASYDKLTAKIAEGNIKARLRMITLYHIARMLGSGMVLSTDNLSEKWMGFWTICGDVGDFGMIQEVLKGAELEDIALYLGVPKKILAVKPDDGLGITNKGDAGQLGAEYPEVDRIMVSLIQQGFNPNGSKKQLLNLPVVQNADPQLVIDLASRAINTTFKRAWPINLTRKHLGLPAIKKLKLD